MQPNTGKPYLDSADFVIIGNGIAGLTAALEARRLAPDKRIVIITEQIHPTINTPALKQFAIAKLEREQLLAYPAGTERTERIHVVTAHVEEIHAQSKYVSLSGDRGFGYGTLLIATGSKPMGLPANLPGRDFDGVMTLHRLQDYLDLRRRINEVSDAVVIGGGVHAIETVMGLLHWGIHVHWLIRSETFMARILDQPSSEMVLENVRRAGATVYTKTEVSGVVGRVGCVAGVITNHQKLIPCQLVLSCTGTQAVTTLAEHCSLPLRHKKGVLVDDQLRTSVEGIFAAGDVAALRDPQTGNYEPRAQWYAAVSQGRIAGAMMAGHEELARRPFGIQWHATHLGELSMLTVGNPLLQNEKVTTLTDTGQGGYRRMAIVDDRLVGYLSLGPSQPDSLAIKRIIDEGHSVRGITRELLKGNFDARKYLSQMRSRAAQGMLTSGNLPAIMMARDSASNGQPQPANRGLSPIPAAPETDPLLVARHEGEQVRQPAGQPASSGVPPYFEEDLSPFTGNLPAIAPLPDLVSEEVSPFTGNLPAISPQVAAQARPSSDMPTMPGFVSEEVSPFTGNLPALSSQNGRGLNAASGRSGAAPDLYVEEISPFTGNLPAINNPVPVPVPVQALRTKTGGLWAYANEHPAPPSAHTQQKQRHNLWSYSDPDQAANARRGR